MTLSRKELPAINKLLCSLCEENFDSAKSLHYHQINCHVQEELSLALLSLKGIDVEEMKKIYPNLILQKADNTANSNSSTNSTTHDVENYIKSYSNEHSEPLVIASSENSINVARNDCLKQSHNERIKNGSEVRKNGSMERSPIPNVILSPDNLTCSQSHIKAIISRLPNIVKPERQELHNSYVLPSPVSEHHRSSVVYDYGKSSIEYRDYCVPDVGFESGVDVACGVEREVQSTETQTGVISIITKQLAKYRKQKKVSVTAGERKFVQDIPQSVGERRDGCEKILQELPVSSGKSEMKLGTCGKRNQQELTVCRKYTCWACEKSYKKKSHLERHIRIHTGERPFSCPYCEKNFAVRSILQQHIRIHTGEKPYNCKTCQQSFPQKSGLLTHMMLHTGKPLKCNHCSKAFVSKNKLLLHLRCHSGLRRHTCRICSIQFYTIGALKQHCQSHS